MKNKEQNSLRERLCRALELPPEILPKSTLIELHGESLLKIQGAGSILLYTPDEIRIGIAKSKSFICVKGKGLSCSSYIMGSLGIDGKIRSIAFCEEGEKNNEG